MSSTTPASRSFSLFDRLVGERRLPYVLGLHKGPLVSMPDCYARATGRT